MEYSSSSDHNSLNELKRSQVYLALVTANFLKDPKCALELGTAIIEDKPIVIFVEDGIKIPKHLLTLAKRVYTFDKKDPNSIKKSSIEFKNDFEKGLI